MCIIISETKNKFSEIIRKSLQMGGIKMRKKAMAVLLASLMVFGLAACGKEETKPQAPAENAEENVSENVEAEPEEEAEGTKTQVKIAWCDDTQDATRAKMLDYMKERIEEIEAERGDIEITLDYYDANKSVDKQISDVETACLTNPDVFIFSCVDSQGSLPCLQTMKDTGAYIIDIRDMGSDIPDIVFYGSDEETYKKATSSWIVDYMEENPDKLPLQVGLIYGAAAQTMQLGRRETASSRSFRIKRATSLRGARLLCSTSTSLWSGNTSSTIGKSPYFTRAT